MVRITIELREELARQAEARARELGLPVSEYLRDRIEHELAAGREPKNGSKPGPFLIPPLPSADPQELERRRADPLFADRSVFTDDLPGDVSADLDKYLADDLEQRKVR